jgi:hypothetical protein
MSTKEYRTIELPATSVPVMDEADVVVVGGGTAGFIAATAAARTGAKTILVERFGYLGGCTTAPYNTGVGWVGDSEVNHIIKGYPWEFLERMEKEGQAFLQRDGRYNNQIWPPYTKKVALDMISDAGVELYLYTMATGIVKNDDNVIEGIIVESKLGRAVISAKAFVDASADGDLAAWTGSPFEQLEADKLQQVSCDYIACGVDAKKVEAWALRNEEKLGLRVKGIDYTSQDFGAQPMLTITIPNAQTSRDAEGKTHHVGVMPTVKLCIYREAVRIQGNVNVNPLDPKGLTHAEVEGIKGALGHLKYMTETVDGFEGAFVVAQSHLGARESRRILGDYHISIDDLKGQSRFEDVVNLNCRALDYHLKGTVFKIEFLKGNHDVPLRALLPRNAENLLVAGRCVSCDHLAHASMRGAATCMATGHSAGTTAALAALEGERVRDLDVRQVQKKLVEQGAILSTVNGREPWIGESYTLRGRASD